jgi:murein DD-endopeptidase MepM/ murein hydrolase activator NlpD
MEERHLTFIVVPHGDLETRTYEISYRRLKLLLALAAAVVLAMVFVLALWVPVAVQASRVPSLLAQLEALEGERAKVVELARNLDEVESQYERVRQLLGAEAPVDSTLVLPPLANATADSVSSPPSAWPLAIPGFITQMQVQEGQRGEHPGLDIAAPANSVVLASGGGVVKEAGEDPVYGKYVLIDHGGGLESLYGHASRIVVAVGERVRRLDVIALSGSTGQSSAPHLHFEIRRNGKAVDPLEYVKQP